MRAGNEEFGEKDTYVIADYGKTLPDQIDPYKPYRVLGGKAPLFGMPHPSVARGEGDLLFAALYKAGVRLVIDLVNHDSYPAYAHADMDRKCFPVTDRGPINDQEQVVLQQAVNEACKVLNKGHGVVIHCHGGTGRTGTVIGCILSRLKKGSGDEIVAWLDKLNKARGKNNGWPEARVQGDLVKACYVDTKEISQPVINPALRNIQEVSIISDENHGRTGVIVAIEGDRAKVRFSDTGEVAEVSLRFLKKMDKTENPQSEKSRGVLSEAQNKRKLRLDRIGMLIDLARGELEKISINEQNPSAQEKIEPIKKGLINLKSRINELRNTIV